MNSPYSSKKNDRWLSITKKLIASHPLSLEEIRDIILISWEDLWSTSIGKNPRFSFLEINPPAQVIGYFLEKLIAKNLSHKYPAIWRGGKGTEKDLHYIKNIKYSIEMKSSGQPSLKVYGNRSYGQKLNDQSIGKKDKSGYYITVNFFMNRISLIRFGWIDHHDWKAQKAASGQMSGLKKEVYKYKLLPIQGDYILDSSMRLVEGVGDRAMIYLEKIKIFSIRDLIQFKGRKTREIDKYLKLAHIYIKKYHSKL